MCRLFIFKTVGHAANELTTHFLSLLKQKSLGDTFPMVKKHLKINQTRRSRDWWLVRSGLKKVVQLNYRFR